MVSAAKATTNNMELPSFSAARGDSTSRLFPRTSKVTGHISHSEKCSETPALAPSPRRMYSSAVRCSSAGVDEARRWRAMRRRGRVGGVSLWASRSSGSLDVPFRRSSAPGVGRLSWSPYSWALGERDNAAPNDPRARTDGDEW